MRHPASDNQKSWTHDKGQHSILSGLCSNSQQVTSGLLKPATFISEFQKSETAYASHTWTELVMGLPRNLIIPLELQGSEEDSFLS